jgi:hypothetical protein
VGHPLGHAIRLPENERLWSAAAAEAAFERMLYYPLPTARSFPACEIVHHESPSRLNAREVRFQPRNALSPFGLRISQHPVLLARILQLMKFGILTRPAN